MAVERDKRTSRRAASEVRSAILAATAAEITEVGAEKASLRSIARRVGISHQALSYHFADRQAVLTALAVDGFDQMAALMAEALANVPPNVPLGEHTIAAGATYVRFAREHPSLFILMLGSSQVDDADPDLISKRQEMWHLLLDTVTRESGEGWGGQVEPEYMALLAWTIVHGIATLGTFTHFDLGVEGLLRTFNRALIKPPHPSEDPATPQ